MYFDDNGSHSFNVLNLKNRDSQPQPLIDGIGSVVLYSIAVDANFIYLSTYHPRYDQLHRTMSIVLS